jgi:hypothetical protein
MKRTVLRLVPGLWALAALAGCATIPSSLRSNPLISQLTSSLGVSPQQAIGGTGALLGLAQNKLSPDQFNAVTNAIPGAEDITKAADPLLGDSPLKSITDVQGAFSKLGMSPAIVAKFAPVLTDTVSKSAGPQVADLLAGAFT